jgi:hypothetical protein
MSTAKKLSTSQPRALRGDFRVEVRRSRLSRPSIHASAFCEIDRMCGAPNDINIHLFGWMLFIRIPFKWW